MIIIVMGVTGSGKTTIGKMLAEGLGWGFYEGDEFHPAGNVSKMKKGIPLNDNDRMPWLNTIRKLIMKCIKEKENAIITCSALKDSYRNLLARNNKEIKLVYLKGDYNVIQKRLKNKNRKNHFMNPNLLKSQFDALEEPKNALEIDISKKPKIIVESIKSELTLLLCA